MELSWLKDFATYKWNDEGWKVSSNSEIHFEHFSFGRRWWKQCEFLNTSFALCRCNEQTCFVTLVKSPLVGLVSTFKIYMNCLSRCDDDKLNQITKEINLVSFSRHIHYLHTFWLSLLLFRTEWAIFSFVFIH